jgi:broad specificity phosphatase PhoE
MSSLRVRVVALALPFLLLAAAAPLAWTRASAQNEQEHDLPSGLFYPRTIVVVRHAEKGNDDPTDPSLSEQGVLRALELAKLLGSAGVTHLFASEFQRTQQTLAPLGKAAGVGVQIVPARDPKALLSALQNLPRQAVAVVAGHSNTVPALVAALAPSAPLVKDAKALALTEADYDRLYVITQWESGKGATALELRY